MSVKAPAEKNFRRAKVRPGGKKGGVGRLAWLRSWRVARWVMRLLSVAGGGTRSSKNVANRRGGFGADLRISPRTPSYHTAR